MEAVEDRTRANVSRCASQWGVGPQISKWGSEAEHSPSMCEGLVSSQPFELNLTKGRKKWRPGGWAGGAKGRHPSFISVADKKQLWEKGFG